MDTPIPLTAVSAHKLLTGCPPNPKIGSGAKFRLLTDLKLSELETRELEDEKYRNKLKESNYIDEPEKGKRLIDIILEAKCPVVMEFHQVVWQA